MVTITDKAVIKVKEIIADRTEENKDEIALRLFVQGGGCSGLSYGLALDYPAQDDHVVEFGDVKVLIDPESVSYVQGSEIDFKDALMGGGFSINNPKAVRTCGCGSSFRTEDNEGEAELC